MIAPIRRNRPALKKRIPTRWVIFDRHRRAGKKRVRFTLYSTRLTRGGANTRTAAIRAPSAVTATAGAFRESLDKEIAASLQSDTRLSGCWARLTPAPSDRATAGQRIRFAARPCGT